MIILHAIVLGIIQGLTEFLPISSSAHLILAPWFFRWRDPGLGFDVALHWGTLLAVLVYFRQDLWLLLKGFWHSLFKSTRNFQGNVYQKLSWFLIVASVPGAIAGKLLEEKAETAFRSPGLIALTMSGFAIILFLADRYAKREKNLGSIGFWDSLLVGLSQSLAVIPGVSRSGSTMTAGLFLKFKREDAAKFSFLMSMPIIFGAGLVKLGSFRVGVTSAELASGFVSSAVFGFLAIKYLLKYLEKNDYKIFVWYRIALAILIILTIFSRT